MNERPIIFSTMMVKAIIAGTKTQTRRLVAPQPVPKKDLFLWRGTAMSLQEIVAQCPLGRADNIWVRETHCFSSADKKYYFRADGFELSPGEKWTPAIYLPRKACRLVLKIKSVRVERLHDISEDDAKAEGVPGAWQCASGPDIDEPPHCIGKYIDGFKQIWEDINGRRSWASNPFVYVIGFNPILKP